jgi:YHS domain-containing protein
MVLARGDWEENTFLLEEMMAIDPVCGMEVDERKPEFQTQFAGRKYFFCSEECRKEFENQPEEFVETAA